MNASMALSMPSPRPVAGAPLHGHLQSLGHHLDQCRHARGPMFALGCLAERVHACVAGRFVTTVMVAVAVLPLASSWS
jgi:hypothetical protein